MVIRPDRYRSQGGRRSRTVTALLLCLLCLLPAGCRHEEPGEEVKTLPEKTVQLFPKVLLVNSYHYQYPWTRAITRAVSSSFGVGLDADGMVVNGATGKAELRIFYMDSKRNTQPEFIKERALEARELITRWRPDVVITSDDNAAKYLVAPFYHSSAIPFVFCGINWSAEEYGFPTDNITGMIEVQLIDQLIELMKAYAAGERIALLKGDDLSARKEAGFYEKSFGLELDTRFVHDFSQWKQEYLRLQREADMILIGNAASLKNWNRDEALSFVRKHTLVPTGNWDKWMAPYSLFTVATKPEEQGLWAARQAMRILEGVKPADIPLVKNREAQIHLNMVLADTMGIVFPMELINQAVFVK